MYPFGHGLSYTHFRYSHLLVAPDGASPTAALHVSFDVTNDGDTNGDEVVRLYVHAQLTGRISPTRQLKGFQRVTLAKSKTRNISFDLNSEALSHYNKPTHSFTRTGGH